MEQMDGQGALLHPFGAEPEGFVRLEIGQDNGRNTGGYQNEHQHRVYGPQGGAGAEENNKLIQGGEHSLDAFGHFLACLRVGKFDPFVKIVPVFQIGVMDAADLS